MRLVDGVIDNEGRVEVCLHGVWGTVYGGSGWSSADAYFVCHQLKLGSSKSQDDQAFLLPTFYVLVYTTLFIYIHTSCQDQKFTQQHQSLEMECNHKSCTTPPALDLRANSQIVILVHMDHSTRQELTLLVSFVLMVS